VSRLIIENRSCLSDAQALYYVAHVIRQGRISGSSYCSATWWRNVGIAVYASRNKASDRLVVCDVPEAQESEILKGEKSSNEG